jgi:NADP-dependent 3-hydroxy acid dehydrogenase YdfG
VANFHGGAAVTFLKVKVLYSSRSRHNASEELLMAMQVSISDRVVLIVGGSSGIGRAAAVLFAREGARVVAAARRKDRLHALREELAKKNLDISVQCADACSATQMEQLAQTTLERFGKIDILLYATGTNTAARAMERLDPGVWNWMIETNLNGAFYVTHAVLPCMRAARCGHLIYLSSIAAIMPDLSGAAYQASKRGIFGLSHAIRQEEQQNGIRSSVICPGLVNTELVEQRPVKLDPEALAKALRPEDVAEMIVFLAKMPPRMVVPELHLLPTLQ